MSTSVAQTIEEKLTKAFHPYALEIINESHLHSGHKHDDGRVIDGNGETHMRIRIKAQAFNDMSRIDRHRAITALLTEEFDNGLHALAIEASA